MERTYHYYQQERDSAIKMNYLFLTNVLLKNLLEK